MGLTVRKTCRVLRDLVGLNLSPGGLSQALARIAKRLEPDYQKLLEAVKSQDAIYTDETSWWVGSKGDSLWVLTNDAGTYYRVVPSRSKAAAQDLIESDYRGVLVSDCLNIYDDLTPNQHKCYAHHLKAISQALEHPAAQGSTYLRDLKSLLKAAMALKNLQVELADDKVRQMRISLEDKARILLQTPRAPPPDGAPREDAQERQEEKLRQRLAKQHDHLFTFLDYASVEATNNRAERQLRPAVINRKLSCGNKTEAGAQTWQILASLAATCEQKGTSFIDFIAPKMPMEASTG